MLKEFLMKKQKFYTNSLSANILRILMLKTNVWNYIY